MPLPTVPPEPSPTAPPSAPPSAVSPASTGADQPPPGPPPRPTLLDLLLTFGRVSLSGFGGVLPWARRTLVQEKHWMTADEFNRLLTFAQVLPGPNVVNLSAVYGFRQHGVIGAAAGLTGMLVPPTVLMIVLGILYERYGAWPGIGGALAGLAAGVAGLMFATAARISEPLVRQRFGTAHVVAIAAFTAIGVLRLPLIPTFAVLAPASVALVWWKRR